MAINIGDATLSVLVDLTQLDPALARVNSEVPAKLKASGDAVAKISDGFGAVGKSATTAATQATAASTKFVAAGEEIKGVLGEAKDTSVLLGEAIGVHLPRSVGRFVAELPGIGSALNAAFSSVAVFILIEAIIKAAEKIDDFLDKPQRIADAWSHYGQTVFDTGEHIRGEIDKEEQKLIEMTQGPVAALDFALKHLQTTAFAVFRELTSDITSAVKAMKEQSGFTNVFGDAAKDLDHFQVALEKAMRTAQQAHPADPLAAYNAAITLVQDKERELSALIEKRSAASGKDASAAVDGLHAERQAVNDLLGPLQQGIKLETDRRKVAGGQEAIALATQRAAQAQRDLAEELAAIELRKAKEHAAYLDGTIDIALWRKAELDAVGATTAAHEEYARKLVTIYTQSGELIKKQAAEQTLANLTTEDAARAWELLNEATQRHRESVQNILKGWHDLQVANVGKDFKAAAVAAEELVRSEQRLGEAQKNLNDAISSRNYDEQIRKVEMLAILGVISEEQKTATLKAIYQQQEQDQLAALNVLLVQEKAAVDAAQSRVNEAKGNPFFTDAQLLDLEKNLDHALTVYTKTEEQIVKTQASADAKIGALDQSLISKASSSWNNYFKLLIGGSLKSGQAMTIMGGMFTDAIGASVSAAVTGSDSFAGAMAKVLKSALAALAGEAIVHAIKEIAYGFEDLATPFFEWHAATHFLAAAKWGAVGAAAAIVGAAVPTGGSSSAGSPGTNLGVNTSLPANHPEQQPVQVTNVQHLAKGGLVNRETLALVHAREVVIPLDDPRAMGTMRDVASQSGGDVTHIENHWHIDGVISADNLSKVVKRISRDVNSGRVRLNSSNSLRVTRRG